MNIRSVLFICAISIYSSAGWGQTWKLTNTMTATLDKNVLTISTTLNSEAMPDYNWETIVPWYDNRDGIHSAVIADKVTSVGTWAFMHCANLTSVTMANSVTSIGGFCFHNCYTLTSVKMSEGLTTIGTSAFNLCASLKEITIPAFVSHIGGGSLTECIKLEAINVHTANIAYSSDNGVLYNKDKTQIIVYPKGKSDTSFEIPGTVKTIESGAFYKSRLKSISIPKSVTEIGTDAFWLSDQLTSITIPILVTAIGENAFGECTGLKEVTVEWWEKPLVVPDSIFRKVNMSAITLRVPNGAKSLYEKADVWKTFGTIVGYAYSGNEKLNTTTLNAYASNGILYISGLQPGQPLTVFNLAGQLIYKGMARSEDEHIPLAAGGIYIVAAGEQTVKAVIQ